MRKKNRETQIKDDNHDIGPDDKLSWLPDHILATILSCLPLKDAAVTSKISRRWRYMWCQGYRLNFDDKERMKKIIMNSKLTLKEKNKYINWVNWVILQHKGATVEEFKICFDLDMGSEATISNWIEFAISKKVHILKLDFMNRDGGINSNHKRNYVFPNQLFSPSVNLEFLKTLLLRCVNVNDEGLNIILRNCPVLENLSVQGSCHMVNPKINGNKLSLKNLEMRFCRGIKTVEIRDSTNIVSFTFVGSPATLVLDNLQNLEKIHIDEPYSDSRTRDSLLSPISFCISYLLVLELDLFYPQPRRFPELPKLKHLILKVNFCNDDAVLEMTSLVEACPNLRRFTCQMFCMNQEETEREVRQLAMHPRQYLEVVEISGYYERIYYLELVTYFLEISVALKKLVIDPTDQIVISRRKKKSDVNKDEEKKICRHKAQLLLEPIIPAGVELVIL